MVMTKMESTTPNPTMPAVLLSDPRVSENEGDVYSDNIIVTMGGMILHCHIKCPNDNVIISCLLMHAWNLLANSQSFSQSLYEAVTVRVMVRLEA